MSRRIIDVYYSTIKQELTDSSDQINTYAQFPHVSYREQALMRLRLRGNNSTEATAYQGLASDDVVNAAIDTVFTAGQMVHSTSADINVAGDWAEADLTKGKLAIRLDCSSATFLSRLSTNAEQIAFCEIQTAASNTTTPQGIYRFPIIVRNTIYTGALS